MARQVTKKGVDYDASLADVVADEAEVIAEVATSQLAKLKVRGILAPALGSAGRCGAARRGAVWCTFAVRVQAGRKEPSAGWGLCMPRVAGSSTPLHACQPGSLSLQQQYLVICTASST